MNPSQYRSLGFAVLGALAALAPAVLADGRVDQVEGTNILLAVLGAANVFFGKNTAGTPYVKWVLAGLIVVAMAVQTAIIGHGGQIQTITMAEWEQIGAGMVVALLVKYFPNSPSEPAVSRTGQLRG